MKESRIQNEEMDRKREMLGAEDEEVATKRSHRREKRR